jgi:D-sedoheptulose 7-phosphate isomerase
VSDLRALFQEVADNMGRVAGSAYVDGVAAVIDLLDEAFRSGHKLLVFGNGGSAADAQHLVAELVGRYATDRRALPAIALTTNQAVLTAWSNDYSFEDVFARQVEALGSAGDVALGISTSGRSPNVVKAMRRARELGLRTVGLTGERDGPIGDVADLLLAVPLRETARIQEVHLVTYHAICAALEKRVVGRS